MFGVTVSDQWKQTYPGAHIGILLLGNVNNTKRPTPLDELKNKAVSSLRDRYAEYSRADLLELKALQVYKSYYKKFKKTYHVQLQLESILHKGKSLPNVSPLVDANFAAEMETFLLTAGHDADRLHPPRTIDIVDRAKTFVQINGSEKTLKINDMMMSDAKGVVCTILYGQDQRTPISQKTQRALYVTYVPPGIAAVTVNAHLETIKKNVFLFAPDAKIEYQKIFTA